MSEIENMPAVAPALQVRAVAALLGSYQYRFGAETQLQERLAAVLKEGGRDFEREYRIDPQNRADFWLGGLVIEVKVDGAGGAAMRQATGVAKAPYVAEFVRLLLLSGQQVLLFGWHREVYSIWQEKLAEFNPVMYTGSESPKQKQAAKDAFVAGEARVMLISLRAGAGIDGLQHVCSTTVFGELDWSPGVHEQCIGRVHRDGQQEPVQAFFLISNTGSDPVVSDVLGVKREQIEGVRNPGEHLVERRDVGENSLRALAAQFLSSHGVAVESNVTALEVP